MLRARVISDPVEPVSLAEAYQHLRIDPIDSSDITGRPDDGLIEAWITAAREYCENFTGLSLALKDYEIAFTEWPATIELPYPPFVAVLGITVSDDSSDAALDPSQYVVDTWSDPSFAILKPVGAWPAIDTGDVARIRYRAGVGDESEAAGPVPKTIIAAMLLLLGHWYSTREAVIQGQPTTIPLGVESLLRPHRVLLGLA